MKGMTNARILWIALAAALTASCDRTTTMPQAVLTPPSSTLPAVGSITISPSVSSLEAGTSTSLTASVLDGNGRKLDGYSVTWSSGDPSVATVASTGSLTAEVVGRGRGQVSIIAAANGRSATITFVVSGSDVFLYSPSEGFTAIQMPSGVQQSDALAINNAGQVVGWMRINNAAHPFLWSRSTGVIDLGRLPGTAVNPVSASATAINNLGEVVGYTQDAQGTIRSFRWTASDGMQDLGVPSNGTHNSATGINDSGIVVGSTWGRGDQTGAFRWTKSKGMEVPNTPATYGARANAINTAGAIAGALVIGDAYDEVEETGVLWTSAGDAIDINACLCTNSAVAINQSGETTGYTRAGTPFRWSPSGTLTTLDLLGRATAINDRGDIVGTQSRSGEGFVWTHAGLTTLPRMGNRLTSPNGINNSGQIVGSVR